MDWKIKVYIMFQPYDMRGHSHHQPSCDVASWTKASALGKMARSYLVLKGAVVWWNMKALMIWGYGVDVACRDRRWRIVRVYLVVISVSAVCVCVCVCKKYLVQNGPIRAKKYALQCTV